MDQGRSHFGGLAGRVLRGVLSRSTLLTGMTLVSCLFLTARGLSTAGRPELFPAAALVLVSLGLAFHAARSAAAHGFVLAPTLARTVGVGVRTAMASALWFVPWMLWGVTAGTRSAVLESIGIPSATAAGLYIFGCLVATPVILISAAHSRSWFDVVSPVHWGRQFTGRGSDLMTVHTIQAGGLVLVTGLCLPLVAVALRFNSTAGLAAAAVSACVTIGYWTTLTGRLCGALHAAAPAFAGEETGLRRFDEGLVFAGPALDTEINRDMPEQYLAESTQPAAEPVSEPPAEDTEPQRPARPKLEAEKTRRYAAPKKPVAFDPPKVDKKKRRTPLLDGELRVEEAMKRFRLDPSHTLSKLAKLNQKFAPNPYVLQALTICLHRTGHPEQAFKAARQAFPLCFEHGLVSLAAAMFYELRANLHRLDLKQDQVLAVAAVLSKAEELAAAAKAYSLVIHADPSDFAAVKGLIDVADRILHDKNKPEAALKVFMFLIEHCSDPAMIEIVRDGITRCRDVEEEAQPV
jgi:hypothetical protein